MFRIPHRKRKPDELRIYKWKMSDMEQAVKDVNENHMTVGQAAKKNKVTRGVLQKIIE